MSQRFQVGHEKSADYPPHALEGWVVYDNTTCTLAGPHNNKLVYKTEAEAVAVAEALNWLDQGPVQEKRPTYIWHEGKWWQQVESNIYGNIDWERAGGNVEKLHKDNRRED